MADDVSHPEIVRWLRRIETQQAQTLDALRELHGVFVSREVYKERAVHVDRRLDDQGRELVDLAASLERHERAHAERSSATWRYWLSPVLSVAGSILVALVVAATI